MRLFGTSSRVDLRRPRSCRALGWYHFADRGSAPGRNSGTSPSGGLVLKLSAPATTRCKKRYLFAFTRTLRLVPLFRARARPGRANRYLKEIPMLIKLFDFDDDLAERLKSRTGQNTGSKAVLRAAEEYLPLLLKLEHRDRQIAELEERLRVASQVIEGARSAAALLRQVPPHRLVATCRDERSAGRSEHLTLHPQKQPPVRGQGEAFLPLPSDPLAKSGIVRAAPLRPLVGEGGGAEKSGIGDTRLFSHFGNPCHRILASTLLLSRSWYLRRGLSISPFFCGSALRSSDIERCWASIISSSVDIPSAWARGATFSDLSVSHHG
ncbi:Uncharacterised protein [Pseudomonas aeruginosa]|nr:Uncharacterised protein [Pseudomonas aeruginosa]